MSFAGTVAAMAAALALAGAASGTGYGGWVGTNQALALPGAAPDCAGAGCVGFGAFAFAWAWVDDGLGYAWVCFELHPSGAGYFTSDDGSFVANAGGSGNGCAWVGVLGGPGFAHHLGLCVGASGSGLPLAPGRCL